MIKEEEIYDACISDKEHGFRMLLSAYQESIYFFIRRMVVSHYDAEDVMQETFIRIFRNLNQFRKESSLTTWIYKIATNECIRFLDKRKENMILPEEINEQYQNSLKASEYIDYGNLMAIKFQKAILTLPEKQRIVFNLRYYEELEYSEISKITGTKAETLKVDYHYAKEKIKNYMTNE